MLKKNDGNLKVLMDLYHCQVMEGDLTTKLRAYLPTGRVGHLQIAGVPDRHEPDLGEINLPYLIKLVDEVQQRQLACAVLLLQARAHRPHVLGFERRLLPDELALVPGFAVV
jgi:sugar phosphate isomerase/epimerase